MSDVYVLGVDMIKFEGFQIEPFQILVLKQL